MDEMPNYPEVDVVDSTHPTEGARDVSRRRSGDVPDADVPDADVPAAEVPAADAAEADVPDTDVTEARVEQAAVGAEAQMAVESVERPAKVMRIGTMLKQLLDEVRVAPLDDAGRTRLKDIYETSVRELASTLSPDLASELGRMTLSFESDTPSDAELRIAQAQIVGWLEGLFHGIQAALFAQQMQARSQLEEMRQRMLPTGSPEVVGEPRSLGAPAARQGYL